MPSVVEERLSTPAENLTDRREDEPQDVATEHTEQKVSDYNRREPPFNRVPLLYRTGGLVILHAGHNFTVPVPGYGPRSVCQHRHREVGAMRLGIQRAC